jgi:hypothetical protein
MSVPANNVAAGGGGGGKMCEHCQVVKAQAKVTFNGVTLKLCKACVDIEQKRVHLARLCERCAQGKQVSNQSYSRPSSMLSPRRKRRRKKLIFLWKIFPLGRESDR